MIVRPPQGRGDLRREGATSAGKGQPPQGRGLLVSLPVLLDIVPPKLTDFYTVIIYNTISR